MIELIQTKLAPPVEPGRLVVRPRLQAMLDPISRVKLTLVQTPAGYGKTSLFWQWHQALRTDKQIAAWVSVDTSDTDPARFLTYMSASLARVSTHFDPMATRFLEDDPYLTPHFIVNALVNKLAETTPPIYIFLDDIHAAASAVSATLQRLIGTTPPSIHFIVSARVIPRLSLAKMRTRGELLELGVDELVFTRDEVALFLGESGHEGLAPEEIEAFETRTEGWITGLKLASLAWRPQVSPREFLDSFAGTRRSVADYFAAEVFAGLEPRLQSFLLSTCVLDDLTPALCDAVTRMHNARPMLDQIEMSGLFLLKLDDERLWYRYHHLFTEFLRRRLYDQDPAAERVLSLRASEWFYTHGYHVRAIDYALKANNAEWAAQILDRRCQDMAYSGRIGLVAQYAKRIPMDILDRHPAAMLTWAWLHTYNLRFEKSQKLLDTVRHRLQSMDAGDSATPNRHLHGLLAHQDMSLAAAHDNVLEVERLAKLILSDYATDIHPYLLGTTYSLLAYAQREQYKLADLDALAAKAHGISNRSGYPLSQIVYYANVGPSLLFAGKLDAAQRMLTEGLAEAKRYGGTAFSLAALPALPALPLGEILYERNALDQAQTLLAEILPSASVFGFVDQQISGYLTQARLHVVSKDIAQAYRVLDAGMALALDRDLERLRMALVAERIRLLLQHDGSADEAARYAKAAGVPVSPEHLLPSGGVTTITESRAIAWARLAQRQGRIAEARHVATQWRRFATTHGAVRSAIRWNILLAEIRLLDGDVRTAHRAFRKALTDAAPERFSRSFLDEGAIVHTLLDSFVDREQPTTNPADLFARELLDLFAPEPKAETGVAIEQPAAEGIYGKLTAKELEILALVGASMRNAEIAARLGMTEGSIKWYLQQIYDKLGTRRRLKAVERARQLGFLV